MTPGLLIAAPASGSGKTVLTLGLLRHYRNAGRAVASIKVGPDYIDPAFHAAATGRPCLNLDGWAMRPATLTALAAEAGAAAELVLGEGVMGLFDGAVGAPGNDRSVAAGSTAEVALRTGWPLVLVVDSKGLGASAAALLHGFTSFHPDLAFAGVVFNRVGSARHAELLRAVCAPLGLPVLGAVPRDPALALPERHLGLVQASEHGALDDFLERAAAIVAGHVDTAALIASAVPGAALTDPKDIAPPLPPLGQRIAVAADNAFAFAYPFVLAAWRAAGAEVTTFSPLADEAPNDAADAVFLPGGYPELHAGRLAGNDRFLDGLRAAAMRGATIYGECGGYMVLGRGLRDGDGRDHAMAGLLPLETSFAAPQRHLGYRSATLLSDGPLGRADTVYRGHEFHFASERQGAGADALFACRDAAGVAHGRTGQRSGRVMGSFLHLVDRAAE